MYKFTDSSKGIPLGSYVIEREDIPEIYKQVMDYIDITKELPKNSFTVSLIEVVSEQQIELEIDPFMYVPKHTCLEHLLLQRK